MKFTAAIGHSFTRAGQRPAARRAICLLTALLLPMSVAMASDNWPQFRGPGGDGHSDAVGLPLNWSETDGVKWKVEIPGEGWSSPVVWGDQVWMTTALDGGKSLRALCVSRTTGGLLHDVEVFQVDKAEPIHATNSYASPTPIIESGRVYVHFGTYGTACLDTASGKPIWKNDSLKIDHEVGPGSSPALSGNLLLLTCDGIDARFMAALDKQTGATVWKKARPGELNSQPSINKAFSTPLVIEAGGKKQAVCPSAQQVVAYDPLTGDEQWRVRYPGFSNVPRPVFGNGLVVVCTGYMKPEIWAIRPGGQGDVTDTHVAWKVTKQVPAKPSPLLAGNRLYMVSDGGIGTCLDLATGNVVWSERLSGTYSASPVLAENRLYVFGENGKTLVIRPGDEFELLATNELDGKFMASPAIAGKAFFLRTTTHLYRIER